MACLRASRSAVALTGGRRALGRRCVQCWGRDGAAARPAARTAAMPVGVDVQFDAGAAAGGQPLDTAGRPVAAGRRAGLLPPAHGCRRGAGRGRRRVTGCGGGGWRLGGAGGRRRRSRRLSSGGARGPAAAAPRTPACGGPAALRYQRFLRHVDDGALGGAGRLSSSSGRYGLLTRPTGRPGRVRAPVGRVVASRESREPVRSVSMRGSVRKVGVEENLEVGAQRGQLGPQRGDLVGRPGRATPRPARGAVATRRSVRTRAAPRSLGRAAGRRPA